MADYEELYSQPSEPDAKERSYTKPRLPEYEQAGPTEPDQSGPPEHQAEDHATPAKAWEPSAPDQAKPAESERVPPPREKAPQQGPIITDSEGRRIDEGDQAGFAQYNARIKQARAQAQNQRLMQSLPPEVRAQLALQQMQLSQKENIRLQRIDNSIAAIKADPNLDSQTKQELITNAQTEGNYLKARKVQSDMITAKLKQQAEAQEYERRATNLTKVSKSNEDLLIDQHGNPIMNPVAKHRQEEETKIKIKQMEIDAAQQKADRTAEDAAKKAEGVAKDKEDKRAKDEADRNHKAETDWDAAHKRAELNAQKQIKLYDEKYQEELAATPKENRALLEKNYKSQREAMLALHVADHMETEGQPKSKADLPHMVARKMASGVLQAAQTTSQAAQQAAQVWGKEAGGAGTEAPAFKPFDPAKPETMHPDQQKLWTDFDKMSKVIVATNAGQKWADKTNKEVEQVKADLQKYGSVQNMPKQSQKLWHLLLEDYADSVDSKKVTKPADEEGFNLRGLIGGVGLP